MTKRKGITPNILNFLGYAAESTDDGSGVIDKPLAVGLAYPWGLKSMLSNGLIKEGSYTLTLREGLTPVPGVPYGKTFSGYVLTEKGRAVGQVGKRLRREVPGYWAPIEEKQPYLDEALQVLRDWQEPAQPVATKD